MSRGYNSTTIKVLEDLSEKKSGDIRILHTQFGSGKSYKDFYNLVFRLQTQGLAEKNSNNQLVITAEGRSLLTRLAPKTDGIWKIVIFDIPEKHQKVRGILRAKLRQLNFKKWQNSIWISPYVLPADIEQEFTEIGNKFFVRLIKTSQINITADLEKMFEAL